MKPAPNVISTAKLEDRASAYVFWLTTLLLIAVPLAFSTAVYRMYSVPKFALLLTGSAALAPLIIRAALGFSGRTGVPAHLLASRHVLLVCLYIITLSVSTCFGASPIASLFGSSYNQMGLITHLCFFICFIGLIVGTGANETRLKSALWAMAMTGLVVATYAYAQFFGRDPFIPASLYTYESAGGQVVRVNSTLGHSNYLGNFLLYTTPISAGIAVASRQRARRLAILAMAVSGAAILFSGTRGAWIGLAAGAITFLVLRQSEQLSKLSKARWRRMFGRSSAIALAAIGFFLVLVSTNPASRNILLRARSLVAEGFTGSGRTILWRDSIKMVLGSTVVGCGPEGFRKAFLAYKSEELARLAPQINNESSHSSYIDAAVSYGLPGAILYVAIIASSFSLLITARRRARDKSMRILMTGLVSSLAAVVVHNFFTFDQISTGFYFFAFAALAQVASNITATRTATDEEGQAVKPTARGVGPDSTKSILTYENREQAKPTGKPLSFLRVHRLRATLAAASCSLTVVAVLYALVITRADSEINKAFASANAGDFDQVVEHGMRATNSLDPAGDYSFLFARTLVLYGDRLAASQANDYRTSADAELKRRKAIEAAIAPAEQSLAHTLTPDANCLLLAYIALQLGDSDRLYAYAVEALKWDPKFSNGHWLMSEAYLARGDREQAAREAATALDLSPSSFEARLALRRARGEVLSPEQRTEEMIQHGLAQANAGNIIKARRILRRAIVHTQGPCPDCHRALASVYETAGVYEDAITEWQAFMREAPRVASSEKTALRVESLRQKSNTR